MKWIVLGGSGFIGSHIVSYFSHKPGSCLSLSSTQCDLMDCSRIRSALAPHLKDATLIIAAGIPRLKSDDTETLCRNIRIISNLSKVLETSPPARMIYLSTVEVYGAPVEPITESTPIQPDTQYGIAKYACELILERVRRTTGTPLHTLRLPGVYGAGDKGRGFIGTLVKSIQQQHRFTLHGGGSDLRDYLFVGDIPRVIEALCRLDGDDGVLNIVSGHSRSIGEIADLVTERLGPCTLMRQSTNKPPVHMTFTAERLKKRLPGLQLTPLEQGTDDYAVAPSDGLERS
ncbi:MAG: NAD-dependent epimerase/dehydratase family protein [Candidatus Sedimenticola sp. (ex Thyasira tokunagai)]